MFILVNYSSDYGMCNYGKFDAREDAAKEIAKHIHDDYNIDIDVNDFIATYHLYDNGDFRLDDNNIHVWFNNYECCCCNDDYEDDWLIIEV